MTPLNQSAIGDCHPDEVLNMIGEWLIPWHPIDRGEERRALIAELQRELDSLHPLCGVMATAVAPRQDNDDVLFSLAEGRFAVVHLTWIGTQDKSPWSSTDLYPTPRRSCGIA